MLSVTDCAPKCDQDRRYRRRHARRQIGCLVSFFLVQCRYEGANVACERGVAGGRRQALAIRCRSARFVRCTRKKESHQAQ